MNTSTEQVMQVLREEYDQLDQAGDVAIQPALVASRTLERLDPSGAAPHLVGFTSMLQLRELARSICRRVSCVDEPTSVRQSELFDGQLQRRYPAVRNGDDCYVLREHLTLAERRENAARLRKEADSKTRHARALDAETDELVSLGVLSDAA